MDTVPPPSLTRTESFFYLKRPFIVHIPPSSTPPTDMTAITVPSSIWHREFHKALPSGGRSRKGKRRFSARVPCAPKKDAQADHSREKRVLPRFFFLGAPRHFAARKAFGSRTKRGYLQKRESVV